MVDFAGALQAGAAALKLLTELSDVKNEYDKAALKLKIAELSGSLLKLQLALGEAQGEMTKKDAEIVKLRSNFKEKQELVEHEGFRYRKGTDGKPSGDPYCPRCMQEGKMMMTVHTKKPGHPQECPECRREYQGVARFLFN
jgi:hypothetical protein